MRYNVGVARGGPGRAWILAIAVAIAASVALIGITATATAPAATPAPRANSGPVAEPAIVGGKPAKIGQWPWQVALLGSKGAGKVSDRKRQFCGGALLAPRLVLTAAHCVAGFPWRPDAGTRVLAGRTRLTGKGGAEVEVSRAWLFAGPGGERRYGVSTNRWDIALLQLAAPAAGTPIQLPGAGERDAWRPGAQAFVTGWGSRRPIGLETIPSTAPVRSALLNSNRLRVARVGIDRDGYCAARDSYGDEFDARLMICAHGPHRDSCKGDSGGPLTVAAGGGQMRLIGITSFGRSCARAAFPGVYGRVAGRPQRLAIARAAAQLEGAAVIAGQAPPVKAPPAADIAKRVALAYAVRQCERNRACAGSRADACTPAGPGYRCRVSSRLGTAATRRICRRVVLLGRTGDGLEVSMISRPRCR